MVSVAVVGEPGFEGEGWDERKELQWMFYSLEYGNILANCFQQMFPTFVWICCCSRIFPSFQIFILPKCGKISEQDIRTSRK